MMLSSTFTDTHDFKLNGIELKASLSGWSDLSDSVTCDVAAASPSAEHRLNVLYDQETKETMLGDMSKEIYSALLKLPEIAPKVEEWTNNINQTLDADKDTFSSWSIPEETYQYLQEKYLSLGMYFFNAHLAILNEAGSIPKEPTEGYPYGLYKGDPEIPTRADIANRHVNHELCLFLENMNETQRQTLVGKATNAAMPKLQEIVDKSEVSVRMTKSDLVELFNNNGLSSEDADRAFAEFVEAKLTLTPEPVVSGIKNQSHVPGPGQSPQ